MSIISYVRWPIGDTVRFKNTSIVSVKNKGSVHQRSIEGSHLKVLWVKQFFSISWFENKGINRMKFEQVFKWWKRFSYIRDKLISINSNLKTAEESIVKSTNLLINIFVSNVCFRFLTFEYLFQWVDLFKSEKSLLNVY